MVTCMGGSRGVCVWGGGGGGVQPPSIFQDIGFYNDKICGTTSGLKLAASPPPLPLRKVSRSVHDIYFACYSYLFI